MKLDAAMRPPSDLASARFFRTGYLPTYAAAVFLLLLVWAGAPGNPVDFTRAWRAANRLGAVEALLLALAIALLTVLLQPLQLSIVRVLEGGFPRWLGSGLAQTLQTRRKRRLERAVQQMIDEAGSLRDDILNGPRRHEIVQQAGTVSALLRSRFPASDHRVRATALGNALAAAEDTAGAAYGLDSTVIWPRLYPVLRDQVRVIVDDLRDTLDASARLAATGALTAVATVALLAWHSGWRTLLALLPLSVAILGYVGAVRAAVAFGTGMRVAFDLHRFDLLHALGFSLPAKQDTEKAHNRAISDFFRQGVPVTFGYVNSAPPAKRTR